MFELKRLSEEAIPAALEKALRSPSAQRTAGIICERRAKARLHHGHPGSGHDAYELLREAMSWYEQAETLRPPRNDDALLHWNTCARLIMGNQLTARTEEGVELPLE